jgi:zinc transport system substrate-binding protein
MRRHSNAHLAQAAAASAALLAILPAAEAADLDVVVTSKSIHALVAGVMGATGQPRLLVTGSASPHTYAMKPSDAQAVQKAHVLFRVSESIEPFTGKLVRSLPKSVRVVSLEAAKGVVRLPKRTGGTFETEAHRGKGQSHDHGSKKEAGDGHVWLDPANAKAMVEAIAQALSEMAPDKAGVLAANATAVAAGIDALDREIAATLAPLAARPFVVFHDAYQYFERRYGLTAVGSITVGPDVQPSAKRLTELRRKIGTLGAVCVFSEPMMDAGLVNSVVEGTRARTGTLDPEGLGIEAGPGAYAVLMRNLATGLKACLGASP